MPIALCSSPFLTTALFILLQIPLSDAVLYALCPVLFAFFARNPPPATRNSQPATRNQQLATRNA
jgi:hypothetical protein